LSANGSGLQIDGRRTADLPRVAKLIEISGIKASEAK
jgi:hypothetical protein